MINKLVMQAGFLVTLAVLCPSQSLYAASLSDNENCPETTVPLTVFEAGTFNQTVICVGTEASRRKGVESNPFGPGSCPDGSDEREYFNPDSMEYEYTCEEMALLAEDLISSAYTDNTDCILNSNPFDVKSTAQCVSIINQNRNSIIVDDGEGAEDQPVEGAEDILMGIRGY